MSLEDKTFKFEEFVLDAGDKTLYRNGEKVNLSLKALEVLMVLIEQRPRVVDKRVLMDTVWPGSFVEDGNLSFTISQLRKALNDNVQNPRIIETAHRRGYRFVADVEAEEQRNPVGEIAQGVQDSRRSVSKPPQYAKWVVSGAVAIVLVGATAAGWLRREKASSLLLSGAFAIEKLSTDGKVAFAVLSKDKRFVAYIHGRGRDKQSIWLRQLESGSHVELIPDSDERYFGLALSPDSNFLYFARKIDTTRLAIFRISIFGGVPVKIAEETQGWMSLSPNGESISYVRCTGQPDDNCSLFTADAIDGKNERKLVTVAPPYRLGANEFAPDGRSIAFSRGQTQSGTNDMSLYEVNLESFEERALSEEKFFEIKSIAWLKDMSLVITAAKVTQSDIPIWLVGAGSGKITKLTKDSEVYAHLSGDLDGSTLVATRVRPDTHATVFELGDNTRGDSIGPASSIAFESSDRIIFTGLMSGNDEIWNSDRGGSDQRQLTNDPAADYMPISADNGQTVYFASNRTGEPHVWRMNSDGSELRQITTKVGGWPVFVSPDGKRVYFQHGMDRTLWSASADGGAEQLALNIRAERFSISRDGLRVLVTGGDKPKDALQVVDINGGEPDRTYSLARPESEVAEHAWSRDGRSLIYVRRDATSLRFEVWKQPLSGGDPTRLADLGLDTVRHFAVSPDGRRFAVIQGDWKHDAVLLRSSSE